MLSPASPWSRSLRNISTPVTTDFCVSRNPTISTASPTFTRPRSTRPVATVPRPVILNTSSTGNKNGFSVSRTGTVTYVSSASSNLSTDNIPISLSSPSRAFSAEPRIIGISSPGNSYLESNSLSSNSTKSNNSGSSIMSTLFIYTTIRGTPT